MLRILAFERVDLLGKVLMTGGKLPELDKRSHDGDVDLNGALAVEHRRKHGHTLLGKNVRKKPAEAAAGRDHIFLYQEAGLLRRGLKNEGRPGASAVPPFLFPASERPYPRHP